jgi:hypothetical protein
VTPTESAIQRIDDVLGGLVVRASAISLLAAVVDLVLRALYREVPPLLQVVFFLAELGAALAAAGWVVLLSLRVVRVVLIGAREVREEIRRW